MANKLDDRYVEYDLANSINVLPVENGGTGTGDLQVADRILISKATGIPESPLKIEVSSWGIDSLGALTSWDSNKGAFEARIQSLESHQSNNDIHLPTGGSNSTFLRGDHTWQVLSATASDIFTEDNFTQSDSNNVQDVLEDFDLKIKDIVQPGLILPFAFSTAPSGFLLCDGAEVSRTIYANLFNYIGETFGSGDGSTTFNVPDLRGQFVRGWDAGAGVDPGRSFGSNQEDEFKSHTHTEQHLVPVSWDGVDNAATDSGEHDLTTSDTGATGGDETRPKNVALSYCIKY